MKEIFVRKINKEQKAEETGRGEKSLRTKKLTKIRTRGHFRSLLKVKIWEVLEV